MLIRFSISTITGARKLNKRLDLINKKRYTDKFFANNLYRPQYQYMINKTDKAVKRF